MFPSHCAGVAQERPNSTSTFRFVSTTRGTFPLDSRCKVCGDGQSKHCKEHCCQGEKIPRRYRILSATLWLCATGPSRLGSGELKSLIGGCRYVFGFLCLTPFFMLSSFIRTLHTQVNYAADSVFLPPDSSFPSLLSEVRKSAQWLHAAIVSSDAGTPCRLLFYFTTWPSYVDFPFILKASILWHRQRLRHSIPRDLPKVARVG